jgi:hypothetical protein
MRCPDCDFELPSGQTACPRCDFRHAMQTAPPPVDESAPDPPAPSPALPDAQQSVNLPRQRPALIAAMTVAVLLLCGYAWRRTHPPLTPTEIKIAAIFAAANGPCRNGEKASCMASVNQIRALHDFPDGSLLLGDYMIAEYLPTQPHGAQLAARWRRDEISETELMSMGETAYAHNLVVCHSFWMYGLIKREHMPVPRFIFSNAMMFSQKESL